MDSENLTIKHTFIGTSYLNGPLIVLQQHDLAKSSVVQQLDIR